MKTYILFGSTVLLIALGSLTASGSVTKGSNRNRRQGGGLYVCGVAEDDDEAKRARHHYYYDYNHGDDDDVECVGASLRSLVVDVDIVDGTSTRVTMVQEFETPNNNSTNTGNNNNKAVYQLPLDESAAVVEFFAETEERTIVAVVKDREKAQEEFDEAAEEGNFAALAKQMRRDVFHISVGSLPPNEIVRVTLSYVTMLGTVGADSSRFVFPTALTPRYEPEANSQGYLTEETDMINDGVRINIRATSAVAFDTIYSNTHDVVVKFDDENKLSADVNVTDENPTDRDVVVILKTVENRLPRIFYETSEERNTTALMLSVVPEIREKEEDDRDDRNQEYVFVLDRSGSMKGTKIEQLRLAVQRILEELPETSVFNIVGFGSTYVPLFERGSRRANDEEAMSTARRYVENMAADLGGTEILEPIRHVLEQKQRPKYARSVFVLTDGEVSNTDDVIEYVRSNSGSSSSSRGGGGRVFALGIGCHVSSALVKGIARAGRGTAEFVDGDEAAAVEDAVVRQMTVAASPALDDVRVDWGYTDTEEEGLETPYEAPPLFAYQRFVAYYVVPGNAVPDAVRIWSGDDLEYEIDRESFVERVSDADDSLLHKMACKSLIRDLEDGVHDENSSEEEVKEEIVRLGVKYQIASSETSFVAVDDGNRTEAMDGALHGGDSDDDVSSAAIMISFYGYYSDGGLDDSADNDVEDMLEECEMTIFPPTPSSFACLVTLIQSTIEEVSPDIEEMMEKCEVTDLLSSLTCLVNSIQTAIVQGFSNLIT